MKKEMLRKYFLNNQKLYDLQKEEFSKEESFAIIFNTVLQDKTAIINDLKALLTPLNTKLDKDISAYIKYLNEGGLKPDLSAYYALLDLNLHENSSVSVKDFLTPIMVLGKKEDLKILGSFAYGGGVYLKGPFYKIGGCGHLVKMDTIPLKNFNDLSFTDFNDLDLDNKRLNLEFMALLN